MSCVLSPKRAPAHNSAEEAAFLLKNGIKDLVLPKNREEKSLESLVASIWEEITQKHVPEMLEDFESLKFVPLEIRKRFADEKLFLDRYE
jgi:hypothetical protein